ncbi:isochorismatase family protein [Thermotoga sp. KOL6]|uniref:isochorismatase family protein n=1 Tax=Thermotoga sp. KOL6 TaxID=126741 RepID=UPI000C757CDD|nr:isochorismatase family protein [Thermotoga sp. KOL6]PLV58725.1 cysteine hydrolase [Thermotoga sp. KOL6]
MFYFPEREKKHFKLIAPALLIIDLQNYFTSPFSPAYLEGVEFAIENTKKLKEKFRTLNLPVVSTVHVGASRTMMKWWRNAIGEEWSIPTFPDTVILKKDTYDAFYSTNLERILRNSDVEQVIITGVMTHLCCETTARSAFVRGFEVVMVEDALWDKNEWYHFSSLKNLAHGVAYIAKTEEILCALESLEQGQQV